MVKWRQLFKFGKRADAPLRLADHPDFDSKTGKLKRRLWTPAEYNAHAEAAGWGTRCYADLTFEFPELIALRDLWFATVERKKAVLSFADFDQEALKPFLPHISLTDCVPQATTRSRYRILQQGSELKRLFGDQTGRFTDEYFPRESLPRWMMGSDVVLDENVPLRFISRFVLPLMSHLDGESFSAPLAGDDKVPTRILSALYVKPKEGVVAASE